MGAPQKNDLRSKLDLGCSSLEDKVEVLDARDLILQHGKVTIKTREGNFLGTCPDMCPEKERYHRKMTNDIVKPYEVDENDPESLNLCIKRYNRSAADKEVELSHELRPPRVLRFTMNHIINCIIPTAEENPDSLPNWYLFVWDRTRAIRKDISVQNLYDDVSVAVVEKIARLHIHCAFRLCQLEAIHFDQKLNSENLTKSIRTLREMYRKRRERGLECPNEAEFHAYHLLLKLGNHLGFSSGLSDCEHVIQSKPVIFVLEIWRALRMFNYVRFFRLVSQEATYLQAALLQRYFTSVRWRALKMIQRTTSKAMRASYPMEDFRDALCFEPDELEEFLVCTGSGIEDDGIVLNDVAESMDDLPNAYLSSVIRDKIESTVEEIINGGLLEPDDCSSHVPHSSFDDYDYLRPEARRAMDQGLSPEQLQTLKTDKSEGEASDTENEDEPYKIPKRPSVRTVKSPTASRTGSPTIRTGSPTMRTGSPMRERLGRKAVEIRIPDLIKDPPSLTFKRKPEVKVTGVPAAQIPKKLEELEKRPEIQPQETFPPLMPSKPRFATSAPTSAPSVFAAWKPATQTSAAPVVLPPVSWPAPSAPQPFSVVMPIPQPQVLSGIIPIPTLVPPVGSAPLVAAGRSITEEVVKEAIDEELERFLEVLYQSVPVVAESLISDTVDRLIRGIAYEFYENNVVPIRKVSADAHAEILTEVVDDFVGDLFEEEIRIETDKKIDECRLHLLSFRTFFRWRSFVRRRRKRRTSMENYPAYSSFLTLDDQVHRISKKREGGRNCGPDEILELQRKADEGLAKVYCINDIERSVKQSTLDLPLILGESLLRRRDELLRNRATRGAVIIRSRLTFKLAVVLAGKVRSSCGTYLRNKLAMDGAKTSGGKDVHALETQVDLHHHASVSLEFFINSSNVDWSQLSNFDGVLVVTSKEHLTRIEVQLGGLNVAYLIENGSRVDGNVFGLSFRDGDVASLLQLRRSLEFLSAHCAEHHPDIARPQMSDSDLNVFQRIQKTEDVLEQSILSGSLIVPALRKPHQTRTAPERRKRVQSEMEEEIDNFLSYEPPDRRVRLDCLRKEFSHDVADVVVNIRDELSKEKEFEAYLRILLEEHESGL